MKAAAATLAKVARTVVSDDGQVLVVERFDIDPASGKRKEFEDFCSLLGLTPDDKYDSTWERVARLTRDYVPKDRLLAANEQLALTLLLTYALGNADCHTKNLAFLYDDFDNVELAPVYDMVTVLAYDRHANNPPGMYLDGRKSWSASKPLWRYLQVNLGLDPPRQRELVDRVCTGVASVVPELLQHIRHTPGFASVGSRMLWEWNEGMNRLAERRTFAIADWAAAAQASGLPRPSPAPRYAPQRIGESPLLAPKRRRRMVLLPS